MGRMFDDVFYVSPKKSDESETIAYSLYWPSDKKNSRSNASICIYRHICLCLSYTYALLIVSKSFEIRRRGEAHRCFLSIRPRLRIKAAINQASVGRSITALRFYILQGDRRRANCRCLFNCRFLRICPVVVVRLDRRRENICENLSRTPKRRIDTFRKNDGPSSCRETRTKNDPRCSRFSLSRVEEQSKLKDRWSSKMENSTRPLTYIYPWRFPPAPHRVAARNHVQFPRLDSFVRGRKSGFCKRRLPSKSCNRSRSSGGLVRHRLFSRLVLTRARRGKKGAWG